MLVDDPLEGGAIAEAVVKGSGWDAAQGKEGVVAEVGLVFRELHAVYAEGDFCRRGIRSVRAAARSRCGVS